MQNNIIEQAKTMKQDLERFIQEILIVDVDYGNIPKTNKRCLYKSGAEKLCVLFGYGIRFEIISREVSAEREYFAYEIKSTLFDSQTGQIVAEGVGSCNSKEKKYLKMTAFDAANTVLKMAKKRSFVDAVLTATASSDMFTQDQREEETESNPTDGLMSGRKEEMKSTSEPEQVQLLSSKQSDFIYSLMSQRRLSVDWIRRDIEYRYKVNDIRNLSREQASEYIKILKELPAQAG